MCGIGTLTIALPLVACGAQDSRTGATTAAQVIEAGDGSDPFVVTFSIDPRPPKSGDNTIEVTVRRVDDGSPVRDGAVTTAFSMPAMPAMNMPAMRTEALLKHEGDGRYVGTSRLSMGGTWNVTITVALGGREVATRRTSIVATE
jgi:hypothetical protein